MKYDDGIDAGEPVIEEIKEDKRELEYAKVSFEFYITKDEAYKILAKPKSQVAKKARKYMNSILEHAASKFFENEDVTKYEETLDK